MTDNETIRRLKALVRQSVEKKIKTGPLVKLASCFDPGVRRGVLSNDECFDILRNAYNDLKSEQSPVRHLFCISSGNADGDSATVAMLDSSSSASSGIVVDGESAAKKMRRTLIQVCRIVIVMHCYLLACCFSYYSKAIMKLMSDISVVAIIYCVV